MFNIGFVLGEVLIITSTVVFFLKDKLYQFLPEKLVLFLLENKLHILILGIIFSIIGVIQFVKSKKKAYDAALAQKNANSNHQKTAQLNSHTTSNTHTNSNMFTVDKNKMMQAKQTSEALTAIAATTQWHPLVNGGANFKTAQLEKLSNSRIQTKKSQSNNLFALALSSLGLVGCGVLGYHLFIAPKFSMDMLLPVGILWIFGAIGVTVFYFPRPRIFDKKIGWYWLGSPKLVQSSDIRNQKQACQLSQITALQIIDEYISSSDSDGHSSNYHSYELNLVLKDGSRLNVMDHGDKTSLLADADILATFLDVPILTM